MSPRGEAFALLAVVYALQLAGRDPAPELARLAELRAADPSES